MKTAIMKIKLVAAVAAGALALSGCMPGGDFVNRSFAHNVYPDDVLKMQVGGHMFRAYVDRIASDETMSDWLENYPYSDEQFKQAWGITKQQAAEKRYIIFVIDAFPGSRTRRTMLVERHWNLQLDDIVDYRGPVADEEILLNRKTVEAQAIHFVGHWPYKQAGVPGLSAEGAAIPQILAVVCRAGEVGCKYNTSPGTSIGRGRHLASVADYRGVEAESGQEMHSPAPTTFATYWGIDACFDCTEENTHVLRKEQQ